MSFAGSFIRSFIKSLIRLLISAISAVELPPFSPPPAASFTFIPV